MSTRCEYCEELRRLCRRLESDELWPDERNELAMKVAKLLREHFVHVKREITDFYWCEIYKCKHCGRLHYFVTY